jgi:hypothetical protein
MSEVTLHIHPTHNSARVGFFRHNGDADNNVNIGPGGSCMGRRASMIYIYGDPAEWEDSRLKQWLRESVMARLVDDNPARVVWGATHA